MKIGNMEVYGVIYKIENKINNKVYIGQTTTGFKKRYDNSKWWDKTHNIHLKNSVKKYGVENFNINKVFDVAFSKVELDIKEITYINLYNSTNRKYGYNIKEGGSHGKHSIESRIKMSKVHAGVKLSESTKRKMSEVRKGKNTGVKNPMYGKNPYANLSKREYKELILKKSKNMIGDKNPLYGAYGELNPFYGKKHSEQTKAIISQKAKERLSVHNPLKGRKLPQNEYGNNVSCKYDIQLMDTNLNIVKTFDSVKRCAEWLVSQNIATSFNNGKYIIYRYFNEGIQVDGLRFERIKK